MPNSRRALRAGAVAALAASLAACHSGPSSASKKTVNAMLATQNYAGAEDYLEKNKERQYGKKNMVLFYLDKGLVQQHQGKYKDSDDSFDKAEKRMEELYTVSITRAGGMFILNDTTAEYAGEPFERALVNIFRALNYVFLGQPDEALVESRKVETFLDELNRKMEKKLAYKDDAFARYLDAMLYADAGKLDDARISKEAADEAYSWYQSLYNTQPPRFEFPAEKRKDHGELVFIHLNGLAPRKVSKTFQIAWGNAIALARQSEDTEANDARFKNALAAGITGNAITVAYPDMVQDPFTVVASEVQVDSESPVTANTVLMEDISAIAAKSLTERQAMIKTRAVARATIKYVLAEVAAKAAAKGCDQMPGGDLAKMLCKAGTRGIAHGAAAASEIADTRGWATLPSQIRMARLKLPAGKHTVTVNFKNAAGLVVKAQVFNDVEITAKKRTYLHFRTAI